jgi:hypothetical protein
MQNASARSLAVQATTDGHRMYLPIEGAFGKDCDYARLQDIYTTSMENETRYPPAKCIGADMKVVSGNPDANTSAPALWNARTSRCSCTCAALRD